MEIDYFDPIYDLPAATSHLPERIYAVVITYFPAVPENPDGMTWGEYYRDHIRLTDQVPPFFWPAVDKLYRSRSSATDKLAQFTQWGAEGYVVECTPTWETIPDANARRSFERSWKR